MKKWNEYHPEVRAFHRKEHQETLEIMPNKLYTDNQQFFNEEDYNKIGENISIDSSIQPINYSKNETISFQPKEPEVDYQSIPYVSNFCKSRV